MRSQKKWITFALSTLVLLALGCKKTNNNTVSTNPKPNNIVLQTTVQPTVSLAGVNNFAVIAGAAVTSTGPTVITGDLGLSPGTSIGGFPPGILNGTLHISDTIASQAKLDLTAAFNDAAGRVATDMVTLSGNIGGLTLTPGLYKSTSSLAVSSGDVTFDALGNANAVFIIQIASTLTTTPGRKVILSGGAQAKNIFWQVSSSASFGTTTEFKGTVMALESITFDTGATLDGRALARTGSVTMDANTFVLP
ncbi:MAG: ice-binding family protein [Crocinitomicaceae bacterium]